MTTSLDLTAYRRLYAVLSLLLLPSYSWVAVLPASAYRPPPLLMRAFDDFPAEWLLVALELAVATGLVALLAGRFIRTASLVLPIVMLLGNGFTYSVGKVDHAVLAVLVPWFGLAAGWAGTGQPRPWVLRLFAWSIGLAFLTAGVPKLLNGWLDPGTHAVRGYAFLYQFGQTRPTPVSGLLLRVDTGWAWELLDIMAVGLELSVIVAAVWWRAWRPMLALLCVFHVGVMALLHIPFAANVLAYAMFLPWSRFGWLTRELRLPAWALAPAGAAAWAAVRLVEPQAMTSYLIVGAGGVVGAWYLAARVSGFVRRAIAADRPVPVSQHGP